MAAKGICTQHQPNFYVIFAGDECPVCKFAQDIHRESEERRTELLRLQDEMATAKLALDKLKRTYLNRIN